MPLTAFQRHLLHDLTAGANSARYLAGGAALHFAPSSARYSDDLDFFHDSVERVAAAFAADRAVLVERGYAVVVEISQPGFVRTTVSAHDETTRVDWAHDSAWRFMPLQRLPDESLVLHPTDLAVNKVLALAGRDEARDFVDILFVHVNVLPLGALVWAATGKDPGFTPLSLLELLRRRGHYHPRDFERLQLATPFDLVAQKSAWLAALETAEVFVRARPASELGCLYWSPTANAFVMPGAAGAPTDAVAHFGRPGGVLPRLPDADV